MHCPNCGTYVARPLTPMERQVIRLIVDDGLSNQEIGARLHVEERTVKSYLASIFRKLDVGGRVELAYFWHTEMFQIGLEN